MYLDLPFLSSLLRAGMHAVSDFKHNITWHPVGTLKWIGQGRQIVSYRQGKRSVASNLLCGTTLFAERICTHLDRHLHQRWSVELGKEGLQQGVALATRVGSVVLVAVAQNAGIKIFPPPPLIQAEAGGEESSDQNKKRKDSQHCIEAEGTQGWYHLKQKTGRLVPQTKGQPGQKAQRFAAQCTDRSHSGLVSPENKRHTDLFAETKGQPGQREQKFAAQHTDRRHWQLVSPANKDRLIHKNKLCCIQYKDASQRSKRVTKQKVATITKRAKSCSTAHRQKAATKTKSCNTAHREWQPEQRERRFAAQHTDRKWQPEQREQRLAAQHTDRKWQPEQREQRLAAQHTDRKWQPEQREQRLAAQHTDRRHWQLVSPANKDRLIHKNKLCCIQYKDASQRSKRVTKQKVATITKRAKSCSTAHRQKAATKTKSCNTAHREWQPEQRERRFAAQHTDRKWQPEQREQRLAAQHTDRKWQPEQREQRLAAQHTDRKWQPEQREQRLAAQHTDRKWQPEQREQRFAAQHTDRKWQPEQREQRFAAQHTDRKWQPEQREQRFAVQHTDRKCLQLVSSANKDRLIQSNDSK